MGHAIGTNPERLKFHPLADAFPLQQELIDDLAEDIRSRGLISPIVTLDRTVLEGRHRYLACEKLGLEPHTVEYDGDDPVGFVVAANLIRRHLDESQRAMVAARLATLRQGVRSDASIDASVTQRDAAALLNVSRPSVQRARAVLDKGSADLVSMVDRGVLAVSAAERVARLDEGDQAAVVKRLDLGRAKNVPQALRQLEDERRKAAAPGGEAECIVICGGAVEELEQLDEPIHVVVTDPPYGIDTHNTRRGGHDYMDGWDYAAETIRLVCERLVKRCHPSAHLYFFSGYTHAHDVKVLLGEFFDVQDNPLIWVKENHTMCDFSRWYPSRHEYIWFCRMQGSDRKLARCIPDVLHVKRERSTTHSAEKPTELLSLLIKQSSLPGELIVDPFAGSGSTGVAAMGLERRFIGIEIDEHWAEVANGRLT